MSKSRRSPYDPLRLKKIKKEENKKIFYIWKLKTTALAAVAED